MSKTRKPPGRPKLFFRDLVGPAIEAKRLRGNSEASLSKDLERLERILPLLNDVPARELTAGSIERAFETLARGDGTLRLKGATINRYHASVSSVLRYAARQGFIGSNPLAGGGVPWSKEQRVHIRYLGGDEERRVLEVIRRDCPDKEAEFMLAVLTGMRRGEQWTLRWIDWSSEVGLLHVCGKDGNREVQVNAAASDCLSILRSRAPADHLFVTPERNASPHDRRLWFEKAVKKAELMPVFHWRDLRHTFASRLAVAGVPLLTIQQLMGHATFNMTLKYAHLSPDHRKQAAEKVGMFDGAGNM